MDLNTVIPRKRREEFLGWCWDNGFMVSRASIYEWREINGIPLSLDVLKLSDFHMIHITKRKNGFFLVDNIED